jgi:hypothetical protein
MRPKPAIISEGVGQLKFSGFQGEVAYWIEGDLQKLKLGPARARGITTTAEVAERAFRAGEGSLTLGDRESYRLTMLGYSAGGAEVFVELRY